LITPDGGDRADEAFIHSGSTPTPEVDDGTCVDKITIAITKNIRHVLGNAENMPPLDMVFLKICHYSFHLDKGQEVDTKGPHFN